MGRGLKIVYLITNSGVCTPVLLYQYYMTYIIYMSVFLQSTCSITIGSCTLKEKVTTSLSFLYFYLHVFNLFVILTILLQKFIFLDFQFSEELSQFFKLFKLLDSPTTLTLSDNGVTFVVAIEAV